MLDLADYLSTLCRRMHGFHDDAAASVSIPRRAAVETPNGHR
jgi:hypothetical protein